MQARLKAEMAERAKAAAIEAEKQAAAKSASETSSTARNAVEDSKGTGVKKGVQSSGSSVLICKYEYITIYIDSHVILVAGIVIKASENALELEKRRRQLYEELSAKNKALSGNQVNHYEDLL